MHRVFQLVAGHPALDLVNTLDYRFREDGTEDLLKSYDDLLRFCEQSKVLTSKQTRQLRRLANESEGAEALKRCKVFREAIAGIFYTQLEEQSPSAELLRTMEGHVKAARLQQTLFWKDSRLQCQFAGEPQAELPLWSLAIGAFSLMTSGTLDYVRACDSPECRWLFLDTSKNHTRRWCDMKLCGNRMKARRFKAQRSA